MRKERWSRGERIAAWTLGIAVVAVVASFFIPEVRQFFHLEKPPQTAQAETRPTSLQTGTTTQALLTVQSPEPPKSEPSKPRKSRKPPQKITTHVTGNENVAGNNVSGDHILTGNNNETGPTAVAPNGIAIAGGTVIQPTVNNFGPPPKNPAVVTVCVGEPQTVIKDAGHEGEVRRVLTLTTDSSVDNPTYGFQFSGTILSKGSASSSPDMAMNVKEGVTAPTSFAFVIYQTWYPGQRINVEVYSHDVVNLVTTVGKHSESFMVKNGGCNSSL
jgi:hypothetical protein